MSKEVIIVIFCLASILLISSFVDAQKRRDRVAPYKQSVARLNRPRIIDVSAKWCGPCQAMKPDWEDAEKRYSDRVDFVSIDWDKGEPNGLIYGYNVHSLPTIIFINRKGEEVNRQVGWPPPKGLPYMIESLIAN